MDKHHHPLLAEVESETRMFISNGTQRNYDVDMAHQSKKPRVTIEPRCVMACGSFQSAKEDPPRSACAVKYDEIVRSDRTRASTITVCKTQQQRRANNICMQYYSRITGWMHLIMDKSMYADLLSHCARDVISHSNAPYITEKHCPMDFPFYILVSVSSTSDKVRICETIHTAMSQCLTSVDFAPVDAYCFETITSLRRRTLRIHWPGLCVTHAAAMYIYRYILCYVRAIFKDHVGPAIGTDWVTQYTSPLPLITTNVSIRTCVVCRNHSTKTSACHTCMCTGITIATCQYAPTCVLPVPHGSDSPFTALFAKELHFSRFEHTKLVNLLRMLSVRKLPCMPRQPPVTETMLFRIPVLPYALRVKCTECSTITFGISSCQRCDSRRVTPMSQFIHQHIPQEAKLMQLRNSTKHKDLAHPLMTRVYDERAAYIVDIVTKFLRMFNSHHSANANSHLSQSRDFMHKHFGNMFHTPTGCNMWGHCVVSDVYISNEEYTAILDGLGSAYCPFSGEMHPTTPSRVVVRTPAQGGCVFMCGCPPCTGCTNPSTGASHTQNPRSITPDMQTLMIYENELFRHMNKSTTVQRPDANQVQDTKNLDLWFAYLRANCSVFPEICMSPPSGKDL